MDNRRVHEAEELARVVSHMGEPRVDALARRGRFCHFLPVRWFVGGVSPIRAARANGQRARSVSAADRPA
jgi:hypothetical protein